LSWLSFAYKLVKMLSMSVDVCLDVKGWNKYDCGTQRLVILCAKTY